MPDNPYGQLAGVGGPPSAPPGPPQGPPQGAPMPPQGGPPQEGQPPAGAAPPNPALADALQILSGHQGKIADLLKDPAMHDHLQAALEAVKQDPGAMQALAKMGITPDKIQLFEQALAHEKAGTGQPAPSWLGALR